jgi:outer membrane protein assembly factor BamE (lipoprotein component of BamABCDE complex)
MALCLVTAIGIAAFTWHHNQLSAATTIRVGDTKDQVRAKLGKPADVFPLGRKVFFGTADTETWAYGGPLEWDHCFSRRFPWFCPIKFRLFGPSKSDIAIEFNSSNKVIRVALPGK